MNKKWYQNLIKTYKTSVKTINKVNGIFTRGDIRYSDLEYEVIVAGFLDNNAIVIDKKPIKLESKITDINGPQKELKTTAIKLLKEIGFHKIVFERSFAGGIADIIAENNKGETIAVECGSCNLIKAIDYLEQPDTTLWVLTRDMLHVVKRGENWDAFYRFHKSIELENKKKAIAFFDTSFRRKIPKTLSPEEIAAMLAASKDNKRDCMLIKCMYFLGLTNTEVQHMLASDVDLTKYTVKVRKRKKSRLVPIPEGFVHELKSWIKDKSGSLFPGRSGGFISDRHIRRIVKKYARLANVRKYEEIHPHTLRHSYATHLQKQGVPLNVIQEILGHARIETTTVYLHLGLDRMKEEVNKAFK